MNYLLAIELERGDAGYHAVVIDIGDDSVLWVTDDYPTTSQAVQAAQGWMERNA
jgi:hypothetical protein